METERHKFQMDLLIFSLKPWLDRYSVGDNVSGSISLRPGPETSQVTMKVPTFIVRGDVPTT
jgi:hypothetical protein